MPLWDQSPPSSTAPGKHWYVFCHCNSECSFFFFKYLFILPALGLSWDLRGLRCGRHVGSRSLTKDQTRGSLHWEWGILTTGPPGKNPERSSLINLPRRVPHPRLNPYQFLLGFSLLHFEIFYGFGGESHFLKTLVGRCSQFWFLLL